MLSWKPRGSTEGLKSEGCHPLVCVLEKASSDFREMTGWRRRGGGDRLVAASRCLGLLST